MPHCPQTKDMRPFVWTSFFPSWGIFFIFLACLQEQDSQPQPLRKKCIYFVSSLLDGVVLLVSLKKYTKCDILRCTQCPPYSCRDVRNAHTLWRNELTAHKCTAVCAEKMMKLKRKLKKEDKRMWTERRKTAKKWEFFLRKTSKTLLCGVPPKAFGDDFVHLKLFTVYSFNNNDRHSGRRSTLAHMNQMHLLAEHALRSPFVVQ